MDFTKLAVTFPIKVGENMSKSIFDLVGTTIQKVEKIQDYFQLSMDSEIMNIFNPVSCYSSNETTKIQVCHAIKKRVINIEYEARVYLKIILEDEVLVEISLLPDDYTGPEAISLYFGSGEVIVFE
jgi:hypothetical protein